MPGVPGDPGSWPEGQCGQYAAKDALARDASVTCVNSNAEGEGLKFLVHVSASQHFLADDGVFTSAVDKECGIQV
jgi:hypothetical protein